MKIEYPIPAAGIDVIVVTTVGLVLAILAVAGRLYARYIQRKPLSTDDGLIIAGLVFTTATIGVGYALVLYGGAGRHITKATPAQVAMALKLFVPAPLLWGIATCLVKLSILFFYIDVFTMRVLRKSVWVVIGLTIAMMIAIILQSFLLCRPFAFTWDKTIPGGTCGDTQQAYLSVAIVNLVIDLALVFLPMPVIWGLKMPTKKKMAISFILGLGLFVCGLTAARIKSVLDLDPLDFTYTMVEDLIFGALEIELGIVSACLPLLRPLMKKMFGSNSKFANGWTKADKTNASNSSNSANWTNRGRSSSRPRSFHRLPEDMHPLGEVAKMSDSSMATVESNGPRHYDLENQGPRYPGDVMVRKDIYVHRSPSTQPSGGMI